MAEENPTWGAPHIHGELLKLGIAVPERTVSRYLTPKRNPDKRKAQDWIAFLNNHRKAIAALDFFTVPTATFRVLYVFFVIHHARRKILHWHVAEYPTSEWVVQQLREALPYDAAPKYLIHRAIQNRPSVKAQVVAFPRVGGLHHRYEWREAA